MTATMTAAAKENPLLKPFDTPHQTPPFSQVDDSMWMPAIDNAIALAEKDIQAITDNTAKPTFDNTIVALEKSGSQLNSVLGMYFALLSANATGAMMEQSLEISSKLSDYSTSIILNEKLWHRVKAVYDQRANLKLDKEQQMLLKRTYDSFAQSGATLEGKDRDEYKKLSAELSALTTQFGQNVQK